MGNFDCCKTKPLPTCYLVCVNCCKLYHRSCILRSKKNYTLLDGYKIKCCEEENGSILLEKSQLEQTVSDISQESHMKDLHMERMKINHQRFIEEAASREEELNSLIISYENTIAELKNEIRKMRKTAQDSVDKSTQSGMEFHKDFQHISLKEVIPTATVSTQTELTYKQETNVEISTQVSVDDQSNQRKHKLLFVSGADGKGMTKFLLRAAEQKFSVSTIIKQNADDTELLKTAISSSKKFSKRDIVVLWPNDCKQFLVDGLQNKMDHCNTIILGPAYRLCFSYQNERIYKNNIEMVKNISVRSQKTLSFLDTNSVLRPSNYYKNGFNITPTGKWFLSKAIMAHIEKILLQVSPQRNPDNQDSQIRTKRPEHHKQKFNGHSNGKESGLTGKENRTNHFFYTPDHLR